MDLDVAVDRLDVLKDGEQVRGCLVDIEVVEPDRAEAMTSVEKRMSSLRGVAMHVVQIVDCVRSEQGIR